MSYDNDDNEHELAWCLMWLMLLWQFTSLYVNTLWHTYDVVRLHFFHEIFSLHFNTKINMLFVSCFLRSSNFPSLFLRWRSGYISVWCWLWTPGPHHMLSSTSGLSGPKCRLLNAHYQSGRKVRQVLFVDLNSRLRIVKIMINFRPPA